MYSTARDAARHLTSRLDSVTDSDKTDWPPGYIRQYCPRTPTTDDFVPLHRGKSGFTDDTLRYKGIFSLSDAKRSNAVEIRRQIGILDDLRQEFWWFAQDRVGDVGL